MFVNFTFFLHPCAVKFKKMAEKGAVGGLGLAEEVRQ